MYTFPVKAFPPQSQTWRLVNATVAGPKSISGVTQLGVLSAGGHWQAELGKSPLWSREQFKTWEALAALCDGGATPFVVPVDNRNQQPFADPKRPAGDPFTDDSTFSDGALWTDGQITATLTGSAALRATQISVNYAGDAYPTGGENFSIVHASGSTRLYRIAAPPTVADGVVTMIIRPPLREACIGGLTVDFDNPRCQMHVVGDMAASIEQLKLGSGTVKFEEDFQPYTNFP